MKELINTLHLCGSVYIHRLGFMFTYVLKNVLLLGGLGTATLLLHDVLCCASWLMMVYVLTKS